MISAMARGDRLGQGLHIAREIRGRIGGEVREARLNAGVSQRRAAAAVGMSQSEFGRIERGDIRRPTVDQLSRACSAVGLKLVANAYPDGDPIRDAAQVALLARFRALLPTNVRWRSEVPLPLPGDKRAWDAIATFVDGDIAVEAETRLRDIQALERRLALKQRDGGVERLILLVNDTDANRRAIVVARAALRDRLPLESRAIRRAIRGGQVPRASGILML
jgi:transcriptional regulator with XRE-family HTH domain